MTDKTKTQTLRQAIDTSIEKAIERGTLDAEGNAGPIAILRSMCDTLDSAGDDPIVWRYVTPASITNLCEKLGLLPSERQRERTEPKRDNPNSIVGHSRWANAFKQQSRQEGAES